MSGYVGISHAAYARLTMLRDDFLGMSAENRLEFTRGVRARRVKPPAKVKPVKVPKPPAEKKPRKKKEPAAT